MAELIGTTLLPFITRRDLLLFDRVGCALPDWLPDDEEHQAKIDFLRNEGFLFRIDTGVDPNAPMPESPANAEPETRRLDDDFRRALPLLDSVPEADFEPLIPSIIRLVDYESRSLAVALRADGINAVPMTCFVYMKPDSPATRADVLRLVVRALPLPGENHSFRDVLDFRDEARSEGLIQGLRVWINEVASGKLTPIEVSDKLEDVMVRYERTLKLEKMRRDTSVVETFVTTTAEIAEALVKFQWSTAAKRLFDVRYKQIDLMKAEMSAPGREVAYIVKARD